MRNLENFWREEDPL